MKRYNYKTKRIYESEAIYKVNLSVYDADGNQVDDGTFRDVFTSVDDAREYAYQNAEEYAQNNGISSNDIDLFDEDDPMEITCVLPDGTNMTYTVVMSQNEGKEITECGDSVDECDDTDKEDVKESVAERFARLRRMFESEDESDENEDDSEGESNDEKNNGDEEDNENDDKDDNEKDNDDDNEDEEMKAVIITVKKGDEDKCKDELVDAGIAEDDIDILDADDDDENIDIRIDVNSVMELKDYLSKKGIDLEEEIGGEIVSDDEDEKDDKDKDDKESDDNKEDDDEEDFDFDDLGDLFGAEDDEK